MRGSLIFPVLRTGVKGRLQEVCGTATFVLRPRMFITCAHLSEEYPRAKYRVGLDPSDLTDQVDLEWLLIRPELDLAVGVSRKGPVGSVAIGGEPEIGEILSGNGFQGGTFRDLSGRYNFRSRVMEKREGPLKLKVESIEIPKVALLSEKAFPALVTDFRLAPGFSGGPVLNSAGQLVGVYSNTNTDARLVGDKSAVSVSVALPAVLKVANEATKIYDATYSARKQ